MFLKNDKGFPSFRFRRFMNCEDIWHGIFPRSNNHENGVFDDYNISYSTGEKKGKIKANRKQLLKASGAKRLIFMHQVHGDTVLTLKSFLESEPGIDGDMVPEGDAMITDVPGVLLVIQVADCQPVLLFDAQKKVVASIHSGWKGSIQNIIGRTVEKMMDTFHCAPEDIIAGVGPSLGPCCGEFVHYKKELPETFWKYKLSNRHFDFWRISYDQLREKRIQKKHICMSQICTKCNPSLFFSYRKEKITGRFASVIGIKNYE